MINIQACVRLENGNESAVRIKLAVPCRKIAWKAGLPSCWDSNSSDVSWAFFLTVMVEQTNFEWWGLQSSTKFIELRNLAIQLTPVVAICSASKTAKYTICSSNWRQLDSQIAKKRVVFLTYFSIRHTAEQSATFSPLTEPNKVS